MLSLLRCQQGQRGGSSLHLMLWLAELKTHELCQTMRAPARGPSAIAYTMASSCWLRGARTRKRTVAALAHCRAKAQV